MMIILLLMAMLSQGMTGSVSRYSPSSEFSECVNGRLSENSTLKRGMKAGDFILHPKATNMDMCVKSCCSSHSCEVVLFVKGRCYEVECVSSQACEPVRVESSKYRPIIFTKNREKSQYEAENVRQLITDPNKTLIREKRHESCHHYHGTICSEYLDKNRLLYFNQIPRSIEERLRSPFSLLKPRLSENCKKHALKAICHSFFAYCNNRLKPKPTTICRNDCERLENNVCYTEFEVARKFDFLAKILPNCTALPEDGSLEAEGCIRLQLPAGSSAFAGRSQNPQILEESRKSSVPQEGSARASQERESAANQQKEEESLSGTKNDLKAEQQLRHQSFQWGQTDQAKTVSGNRLELQRESLDNSSAASMQSILRGDPLGTKREEVSDKEEKDLEQDTSGNIASGKPAQSVLSEQTAPTGPKDSELAEETDPRTVNTTEPPHLNPTERPTQLHLSTPGPTKDRLQDSLGLLDPIGESKQSSDGDGVEPDVVQSAERDMKQASPTAVVPLSTPTVKSLPSVSTPTPTTTNNNNMVRVNSTGKDEIDFAIQEGANSTSPPIPTTNKMNKSEGLSRNDSISPTQMPTKTFTESSKNVTEHSGVAPGEQSTGKPSTTRPTAKKPQASLKVSAGENSQLILPSDTISLYASAWPKETSDNPYSYHWQQISAPGGSHGYMAGQDTQRVTLSQLDEPGVYQFKVKVTSSEGAYGYAHVNVTVKPAPRVNKPPRADISPKEQTITLPTNEVVLDGSQSSDDDKIAQYKWEEVKGPLNDKHKVISSGADSPVLQLKSLVPGIYTFKLTVTDSDGASDSAIATVTVNNEKDYPPVARAGNDVVLTLPVNHVTLYGNGSTDDKGIVSYEWSKAPSSPAVGDMQGTSSPILKVSNMVVGDYTFMLKVTDRGGQTAISSVTVVVQPEKNTPPVAKAGSDKDLVYPDDTTTLDGKDSRDDQKIVKYHWQQTSGPDTSDMSGADERVVTIHGLKEGRYVFQLTVTDDKGLTDSDTVAVNVKKDVNKPPQANAGADVVVYLPNRAAELDGSQSSDDHGIMEYEWARDPKSPAAGDVINNSDHQAVLRLSNVVEGMYKFKLTVVDAKGLKSSDESILTVKEDENSAHLVELYLDVDITKFTQDNKEQLIRKLAVILNVQDEDITVEHLKESGAGHSLMVIFYVKGKLDGRARDGQDVADLLKQKIENEEGFFEFRMLKVEPYICRNNCSGHGYCDKITKLCVCESFWMQDFFKTNFGVKETNCDWSILYVTVIVFGIIMGIVGIIWGACWCMGRLSRKKLVLSVDPPSLERTSPDFWRRMRGRKRHRYAILDDDDKAESMEMLPKGKYMDFSDTEEDSDEETTVFEAKKRIMNGTLNGHLRRDT